MRLHENASQRGLILYIGWLGHGNLGDEIVFDLLLEATKKILGIPSSNVTIYGYHDEHPLWDSFSWTEVTGAILGGGSTLDKWYLQKILWPLENELPVLVWTSGYQKDSGVTEEDIRLMRRLDKVTHGAFRGELTKKKIAEHAGIDPRLPAMSDIGLLSPCFFSPCAAEPLEDDGFARLLADGRRLIAYTPNGYNPTFDEGLFDTMRPLLEGFGVIMQPVDEGSYRKAVDLRERAGGLVVYVNENYLNYTKVLRLFSFCEFAIGTRLHSTVLAHSVGVPVFCLGGGVKFDDYFSSLGFGEDWRTLFGCKNLTRESVSHACSEFSRAQVSLRQDALRGYMLNELRDFLMLAVERGEAGETGLVVDKANDKVLISVVNL